MQKKMWYNVEVPRTLEKKSENFSLKMPESLLNELAEISEQEDRPLGYVGRELMIRGLALYRQDGKIRDGIVQGSRTVDIGARQSVAVLKEKAR